MSAFFMDINNFQNKLYNYLKTPSVIGFEAPFFNLLEKEADENGINFEFLFDRLGRKVLLALGNSDPNSSKIITAHIDRHGLYKILDEDLIYSDESDDIEYASSFIQRKEFDRENFNYESLERICTYFVGERIAAYDPFNEEFLKETIINDPARCNLRENLSFDIPQFRDLSLENRNIMPIAFLPEKELIQEGFIKGQIDNAISVAILMERIKANPNFILLLTADEEIGLSWEYILRWFKKHEIRRNDLLVLDTSPYAQADIITRLHNSGAVVLRNKDTNHIFNKDFTSVIESITRNNNVEYDYKDTTLANLGYTKFGITELGRVIAGSNGEITGTTLQIPTSEYHTNKETAAVKSVDSVNLILDEFLA